MTVNTPRRLRCAVYTRKSSEEGLDMEFNSLDAQREACEAYIASQKAEGWDPCPRPLRRRRLLRRHAGTAGLKRTCWPTSRPGLVDVIVVYKIDRLSRSLMDFRRLVEVFDKHVTFVSVTQSFNTTTSMGRLTLNILLSFAQFEREVIGERIRDKIAASRARACGWAGSCRSATTSGPQADHQPEPRRRPSDRDVRAVRRAGIGTTLAGTGRRGREQARQARSTRASSTSAEQPGLSRRGRPQGHQLSRRASGHHRPGALGQGQVGADAKPTHPGRKHPGQDARAAEGSDVHGEGHRHDADRVEKGQPPLSLLHLDGRDPEPGGAVVQQIRTLLLTPEVTARAIEAAQRECPEIEQPDVVAALRGFDALWESLFPAEQARIARLLVERVTVGSDGMAVDLRTEGLGSVVREMVTPRREMAA
jgi:site-specific DNA recombinase